MDQVMTDQTLALEELNRKVDTLTTQVAFLAERSAVGHALTLHSPLRADPSG